MTDTFAVISPVDGQVYRERHFASKREVESVLQKSEQAQKHWQTCSLAQRQAIAHKAIDQFVANSELLAEEITWQMGRPISQSPGEIRGVEERARYMIDIASEALVNYTPQSKAGFSRFIAREPLGTVLVIAPWNYPYLTAINSIIPALIAGNTVILKHASQTPLCAERLVECFTEAGLPEGVFQYLHMPHSLTEQVMQDHRIGFVNFTGSVPAGRKVQQTISQRFIRAGLELGGKDPAYVRQDAHLPSTVENLVDGSFFNSGQSCCGIERIYVHRSVMDEFVEQFVSLTNNYNLGNPTLSETNLGPVIRTEAAKFVRDQVDQAVSSGARALITPDHFSANQPDSPYLAPQVLVDVNHSMKIMTEESFGPVVGIMPVDNDEEAIALMNDSRFGLTASIWTQDEEAALSLGQHIQTGTVFMNRCDYLDPALVWTGVKDTGCGQSLSIFGYDAVTRLKSFHLKHPEQR